LGLESVASPSLSSLVSQWFITGVELMDYRIPEDPNSPVPVEGYVVSFVASIVQHYHLELQLLTLSGILHITTFVTLCEAHMEIDPHFDLRNYFFYIRRP
jgi:hypothetical protein